MFATLFLGKPGRPTKQVTFRKLKSVTARALSEAIDRSAIPAAEIGTKSLDELCHLYNSELQCILDTVAPQKSRNITIREEAEWYTDEIRQAKQMRRRAERVWRKTGLTVHRQIFMERKQTVNNLLWSSKVNHYKCLIAEHKSDTKQLFRTANRLLGRQKHSLLPSGGEINVAKMFSRFSSKRSLKSGTPFHQHMGSWILPLLVSYLTLQCFSRCLHRIYQRSLRTVQVKAVTSILCAPH